MRFHRKSAMIVTSTKGVDVTVKRFALIMLMLIMAASLLGCTKAGTPTESEGTMPPFTASMTMPVLYEETQEGP